MNNLFAGRMSKVHRSFVTEILRVTENPETISFAGGMPNARFFPIHEIAEAADRVLAESGQTVLQYTTTQGYAPLRAWIAERYGKTVGLKVAPEEVVVTNGSQQALDLIGKVFLDPEDRVAIERPGYHGALQALSLYQPVFAPVPLLDDGIDLAALDRVLAERPTKLFYAVPTFQNPSSRSYSQEKRERTAEILARHGTVLIEDDPYSELRFEAEVMPPITRYFQDSSILLGTFSKTIAPGLRLGWTCARKEMTERLTLAKQASDFHSDYLAQRIVHRYLVDNDLDAHILILREAYRKQRDQMLELIARYIPPEVRYTHPEGGMFVWMILPEGISSMELFELAAQENVAFVPGRAFHLDESGDNTLRLSYSMSDDYRMEEGLKRLAAAIKKLLAERM